MNRWIASAAVMGTLVALGGALAAWKVSNVQAAAAAAPPEPVESVTAALAREGAHRPAVTAIGTVLSLRSVTLRNELAGTVRKVNLRPGQVVEAGSVLVALDVAVEEADLRAQQAQAELARTSLERLQRLRQFNAAAEIEVDRARAERDVALAQIARTQAIIERKTIRVPFRARVGIADVHPGQYLNEGTALTTLQSVDDAVHVDFSVPQDVAAGLKRGDAVDVHVNGRGDALEATVVALDARVDPGTRNAVVRARIDRGPGIPAPGASVRVSVAAGAARSAVVVPASALRKGPEGDHVFVLAQDREGRMRAQLRAVRVVATLADEVLIDGGLQPGEQVAASGSFKLRDAVAVAVAGAPQPTPRQLAGGS